MKPRPVELKPPPLTFVAVQPQAKATTTITPPMTREDFMRAALEVAKAQAGQPKEIEIRFKPKE